MLIHAIPLLWFLLSNRGVLLPWPKLLLTSSPEGDCGGKLLGSAESHILDSGAGQTGTMTSHVHD